jgi:hypothetical protein
VLARRRVALAVDNYRRLIEIVARAFGAIGQWPLFPHVEAALDHEYGLVFDEVISDVPPGLVWSPGGYGPLAEVRASFAALAAIGALAEDLDRYVALVRRAATTERDYTPGPLERPDLRVSASNVVETAALDDDDKQALQRLRSLVEVETYSFSRDFWTASGGSRSTLACGRIAMSRTFRTTWRGGHRRRSPARGLLRRARRLR